MLREPGFITRYAAVVPRMFRLNTFNVQNAHFLSRFCNGNPLVELDLRPVEHPVDRDRRIALGDRTANRSRTQHVSRFVAKLEG